MSVAARKITVVVGGSSGELIEAVGKAQDALKSMADVLVKVSQTSVKANETTIKSNTDVAASYEETLATVHKGEYVVPREGTLAMGGSASSSPPINVHNHMHIHGNAKAFIEAVDSRVTHPRNVQAVSRQMMQRTQLIGGRVR